ncbi:glycosyltransferase [bacterium]|nr:glycosyltransferase [bacterium]
MTIGGVMCAKDEADGIVPNLLYHLELQGFDKIVVIENGSHDRTWEVLRTLNDPRVILHRVPFQEGYVQEKAATEGALELFHKHNFDWVLSIDADEFWVSEQTGSVRNALERIKPEHNCFQTKAYDFVFTERDGPADAHFTRRMQYAVLFPKPKEVLYRAGDHLQSWGLGSHEASFDPPGAKHVAAIHPSHLCRYHYRYISREQILRKVLDQVEGFILLTGGRWLYENDGLGAHILDMYKIIKEDRFNDWFASRILSEEAVRTRLKKGSLFHKTALQRYKPFFDAVARQSL